MTDYRDIPDSEIESEKPVTYTLLTALRDNPKAIAEGSAGAPSIILPSGSVTSTELATSSVTTSKISSNSVTPSKLSFVRNVSSGSTATMYEDLAEKESSDSPPSKTSIFLISQVSGTISYEMELKSSVSGRNAQASIYVNDSISADVITSNVGYTSKTGTISVSYGDEIHLRLGDDGGLANTAYMQNFKLTFSY